MLGKGGMGEVWAGEHALTGRRVAVKILADRYLSNKKVVARFGREARAASAVQHEGIVEILDQDKTDEGIPFLVMEFLEGESVGQRIKSLGKLSQDEALAIVLPLLDALDAAHQAGVIHRDLKPDNVFILPGARGEERIKILDFGISQKSDEIEHHLTQEGSVLGTPHYMSPEQARGEANIDGRVDVYAVGVMFFECVVGDVPFDANNYNALLQTILGDPAPSPRSRGAQISAAVEQVILAAMDKRRDRRPPGARVFHSLLLEAGMQENDALLDVTNWTFSTPSGPPPSLDFAPDEFPGSDPAPAPFASVPVARAVASTETSDLFPHLPSAFDGEVEPLAASAGFPASPLQPPGAAARRAMAAGRAGMPAPVAPLPAPPRYVDERALSAETTANRPGFGEAPFTDRREVLAGPASPGAPRRVQPPRPATQPRSSGVLRAVVGWALALVAMAALAYLANTVFKRPDPRKLRKAQDSQLEPAAAGSEAAGAH